MYTTNFVCNANLIPSNNETLFHAKQYDYRKLNCSDLPYITATLFRRRLRVGGINNSRNETQPGNH